MSRFAATLQHDVGRPVRDATGVSGEYDFTLSWAMDAGSGSPAVDLNAPDGGALQDIFAALQQQLGLKLEAKKGMVDILVIDHLDKTLTEN